MNERIKELAREAGLLAYNPAGNPTKLDKFAELIIKECIRIDVENRDAAPGVEIAKYFGVE